MTDFSASCGPDHVPGHQPGPHSDFLSQYRRVFEAAGCRTQVALATFLGIRQSSISDAKRRGSIPPEWLLRLLHRKHINPDWILTGQGARWLHPLESIVLGNVCSDGVEVVPGDGDDDAVEHGGSDGPAHSNVGIRPPEFLRPCSAQDLVTELVRRALHELR